MKYTPVIRQEFDGTWTLNTGLSLYIGIRSEKDAIELLNRYNGSNG